MNDPSSSPANRPNEILPADPELQTLVYEELRSLAAQKLADQPGHTLHPTTLVHEAWQQLANKASIRWWDKNSYLLAAAEVMRGLLIERAVHKTQISGAKSNPLDLDRVEFATHTEESTLLRVDLAISKFAEEDRPKAQLVKLRFFCGLSLPEAASVLGVPEATARLWWAYARAWLYAALTDPG
jgi:RNA polymerase sigma factor (TIGR02999 family)